VSWTFPSGATALCVEYFMASAENRCRTLLGMSSALTDQAVGSVRQLLDKARHL
jgi:hypothetical protein